MKHWNSKADNISQGSGGVFRNVKWEGAGRTFRIYIFTFNGGSLEAGANTPLQDSVTTRLRRGCNFNDKLLKL